MIRLYGDNSTVTLNKPIRLYQDVPPSAEAQRVAVLQSDSQVAEANVKYASSFKGFLGELGNTFKDIGGAVVDTGKTIFQQGIQAGEQFKTAIQTGTPSQKIAAGLNVAVAGFSVPFFPVSAAFAAAQKIPVLKPAADLINFAAGTIPGKVGEFAADKFTDTLPISQQAKDNLRPALKSVGSFAAQIWLGGKILEKISAGEVIDKTKIDGLVTETKKVPVKDLTPNETPIAINKKEIPITNVTANEVPVPVQTAYPLPNQLPTIDVGKTPKSILPTIQVGEPQIKAPPGLKYEKISLYPKTDVLPSGVEPPTQGSSNLHSTAELQKPLKISTPTENVNITSEFSKSMEGRAIADKLTKSFGELPGHDRINMLDQAGLAYDMIQSNPERALRIAKGEEAPPSNMLPGTMAVSLGEYARLNGDVATMREIALSPDIAGIAQAIGQGLKSFDTGARESIDPVKIMRDVAKARESSRATPKVKAEVVNEIKAEIKKSVSGRPTWEEFVKEVQCGY